MLKKTVIALMALVFAVALVAPAKANAQVSIGVQVGPVVAPPPYGYVVVRPSPYVVAPAPYVVAPPRYVYPPYVYPGPVVVGRRWYPRPYPYAGYAVPRPYPWRR